MKPGKIEPSESLKIDERNVAVYIAIHNFTYIGVYKSLNGCVISPDNGIDTTKKVDEKKIYAQNDDASIS